MAQQRINKCGKCKEYKAYPLIQVPLGPASFEQDEEAIKAGLDIKKGIVRYSWFCLPDAISWLAYLSEEYLTDGTVVPVKKI